MLTENINASSKSLKNEVYRKLLHLSSLWMPLLIYLAPREVAAAVFVLLLAVDVAIEYLNYKRVGFVRKIFERIFIRILRREEVGKNRFCPSGSVYLLAAAALVTLLFSKEAAVIGMTVVLVSDACAAVFGKMFGTVKIHGSKSLEGTATFFLSALGIMAAYHFIFPLTYAAVAACIAATLCELYEDVVGVDDNFSIPLVAGAFLMG